MPSERAGLGDSDYGRSRRATEPGHPDCPHLEDVPADLDRVALRGAAAPVGPLVELADEAAGPAAGEEADQHLRTMLFDGAVAGQFHGRDLRPRALGPALLRFRLGRRGRVGRVGEWVDAGEDLPTGAGDGAEGARGAGSAEEAVALLEGAALRKFVADQVHVAPGGATGGGVWWGGGGGGVVGVP